MNKLLLKIVFAVIVIGIIIFIANKFIIKKYTSEINSEQNISDITQTSSKQIEPFENKSRKNEIAENNTNEIENSITKEEQVEKEYNCLVIGNSITLERDGIGMAASDEYHDYYYLLKKRLEKKYSNVNMNRISAIDWEENRKIVSRTDWINENLPEDLVSNKDLVIFQIGDNTVPTENFEESVIELVNHVKNYSPNARMVLVGMWFINEERLAMMPQIARNLNMDFVDISDLVVDENKSYIGAEITGIDGNKDTISTIEEAFHPNDIGMEKIAQKICTVLGI